MPPKNQSNQFLVIGGGVVGLSLAWELSERGQAVTVVSAPDQALRSASWAGGGILPPAATKNIDDPYDQLRSISHRLHPIWAEKLRALTHIDNGFSQCGGIYLATTRAESATLTANQFWWEDHGIDFECLDLTKLLTIEPNLKSLASRGLQGAWRLPGECQIRNPWHLAALRRACELRGVNIVEATIQQLTINDHGTATAADADGIHYTADKICLCSGAWTRLLMDQVELASGMMPIRGQMVLYKCDRAPVTNIINEGHRYLVPREDGYLLAGSVEEEVGFVCETTDEAIQLIRRWAESMLPELAHLTPEKTWAGLRPGSFDGLPYMGAVATTNNLYIAAGHFRSGLHMSCGTAEIMADLMMDKPTEMDISPFRIARG